MDRKPFSVLRLGMESRALCTPTYPFPGTLMLERIVASVQLLLIGISGCDADQDLDLRVDMTPIEERPQ